MDKSLKWFRRTRTNLFEACKIKTERK